MCNYTISSVLEEDQSQNLYILPEILPENDFATHKTLSLDIIDKYQYFDQKKAHSMIECGRVLFFDLQQHQIDHDTRLRLSQMFTCKDRFCPFCNWRRARKLAVQSYAVLQAIQSAQNVRFLFLTLTIRNPDIVDLRPSIARMMQGFTRLFKLVRVRRSVLGWMRALECHPQRDCPSKAHPHFHVLLVVPAEYFRVGSPLYIPQMEWVEMWRQSMRLDYSPSVDIRAIRPRIEGGDAIAAVVAEACKYPVKSTDLSQLSVDDFRLFVEQMRGVRSLGYGGIVADVRRRLLLDDVEDGDLVHLSQDDDALWQTIAQIRYQYMLGRYGLMYYKMDNEC